MSVDVGVGLLQLSVLQTHHLMPFVSLQPLSVAPAASRVDFELHEYAVTPFLVTLTHLSKFEEGQSVGLAVSLDPT